jgi:hypothetical protein
MSLRNDALKKAQRLRTELGADPSGADHTAGTRIAKRGKAHSANTMVLIGSGALVLVVLSVVFTVYLVNRPAKPTTSIAATPSPGPSPTTAAPAAREASTPAIVAPSIIPPVTTPATVETVAVAATLPSASTSTPPSPPTPSAGTIAAAPPVVTMPSPSVQPAPAAAPPAASIAAPTPAPPAALAPDAPDERVAAFVDAIRVTGIRSSGAESRVLMNERVYRVNDLVERTLGVRLVKAAGDSLTFADPRGFTYVKQF